MFFLITGNDREKARAKARELVSLMEKKRPGATSVRVLADTVTPGAIDELVESQGLFEAKTIAFFDEVFQNEEVGERLIDMVSVLKSSQNGFVIFEEKLSKKELETLSESAERVFHFDAEDAVSHYNLFTIADAFGSQDKKRLWVLVREALEKGIVPEEIHGIIWWQAKAIALTQVCKDAKSAGLAPFAYTKAKRYSILFPKEDMEKILEMLVSMYHDAHRGLVDFSTELEAFTLSFPISPVEK